MMCRGFQTYLPGQLAEVSDALRGRDAPRLREAAHKLCSLLFAFSTAAGDVATDLEDHAAQGRLDEARPLVEQLEAMGKELLRLVGGLSLDALREQVGAAGSPDPAAGPGGAERPAGELRNRPATRGRADGTFRLPAGDASSGWGVHPVSRPAAASRRGGSADHTPGDTAGGTPRAGR